MREIFTDCESVISGGFGLRGHSSFLFSVILHDGSDNDAVSIISHIDNASFLQPELITKISGDAQEGSAVFPL